MPSTSPASHPAAPHDWFATSAGQAVIDSEQSTIPALLGERPGQPWLWLSPQPVDGEVAGRGLCLARCGDGWRGPVACALPLPLPSETFSTVVLQHVLRGGEDEWGPLLEESARILAPGGHLWLFLLNPLSPYRWRWRGNGLSASEPLFWRRRLRAHGLEADAVSFGVGPGWESRPSPGMQRGPGLRAAYALRSEKRRLPLTPHRGRRLLALPQGVAPA